MKLIMLIKSQQHERRLVATLLENSGYEVQSVRNAEFALKLLEPLNPDLIICDLDLPETTGIDLIKVIRGIAKYQYTPILIDTTGSGQSMLQEGKNAGANDWISNSNEPEILISVVESHLR